ncbi:MAG: NUDIX domain-containing protein [Pelagibacteraceae bacterium]|nr:NUDIX domain-containing protein [Pelagibacteraceae bacterium]MBT4645565.1 NUDIX domain-containing protein [Pelagibacteraceae bacterium]MBT6353294.1 NUDIX domain-containing protein [Pelagibacteraceae bacterium]MBT6689009.1 NUDIX domain-containing protein [Flavobacteriaceae bacterium]
MKLKYKILNKINLYSGFFSLNKYEFIHQKHDGEWTDKVQREVFSGAHVSTLLPYDPIKKEIVLIQQFRAGVISRFDDDYLYEIVAGIIEEGENAEETAKRECLEETGCEVKKITPIQGYFPAPGSSESYYELFLGEIISFDGVRIKGLESENENILVKSFKINEVKEMLKNNQITNGLTLIALQWFFLEYYKD